MNCPEENELVGFLQRKLPDERIRSVEEHFAACDGCRQLAFALASSDGQLVVPPPELAPGSTLGRFTIGEPIARGAMGVIYRAHDPTLRRDLALKLTNVGGAKLRPDAQERLLREAQGLARLEHPNVVTVYETGIDRDQVFIAMELIDGVSLDRWLAAQPRGWREIAAVMEQAGRGLAAAHAAGLVHRDFKPANVMIASDGRVKVVDLGLARMAAEPDHERAASTDANVDAALRLTLTGMLVGTPAYCAPEQLAGEDVDAAADVFSFCVTFYESIYGSRPYAAATATALLARMRAESLPAIPARPRLPLRLRQVLRRGLAVDRAQRSSSLDEILGVLAREPVRRRRRLTVLAAAALTIGGVLTTAAVGSDAPPPCGDARGELASVWGSAHKDRVRAAILGTRMAFAGDTWQRVEQALDGYAGRWAAMHVEACEATAVKHTQSAELLDRRMACLRDRRADLDAAVTTLAETTPASVREALHVVAGMPSITSCTDGAGTAPLPTSPADVVQLASVRQEIAHASALQRSGLYTRALDAARHAVASAERLGNEPLRSEALYARAVAEMSVGNGAARGSMEQAMYGAAASGLAQLEARTLSDLALMLRDASPDGKAAISHARHALAIVERTGKQPLLEATVRFANARVHAGIDFQELENQLAIGMKQLDAAERTDPEAAALLRIEYEITLANAEPTRDNALPAMTEVLAHAEKVYGANHPALATILGHLTGYAVDMEEIDQARVYATRMANLLAGYPGQQAALRRIDAYIETDVVKKKALYEQVVRDTEELHGPDSPQVAAELERLAGTMLELDLSRDAKPHIDRAVAIWDRAYGGNYELLVVGLTTKAQVYADLDQNDVALAAGERAYEISMKHNTRVITKLLAATMLVDLSFQNKQYERALDLLHKNLALLRVVVGADPAMALFDFIEAASQWELNRNRPDALRRARAAYRLFLTSTQIDVRSTTMMRTWLAKRG
ncbi:MAG TPA: serine/threonine-protein kinase [Kofleriaceae bacterium]